MQLSHVSLINFRCFEELEIELHPRLTVIVGSNGAGKTSILDGIAAGLTPVLRYLSSANQRLSGEGSGIKDTDFRLIKRPGRDATITSDFAQIKITAKDGLTWDYWRPASKGKEPESKIGETSLASHLKPIADQLTGTTTSLLPVFAYYGANRGIDIPERLRATTESYTHQTAALVGALDSSSNFKEMLKWFDDAAELRANKGRRAEDFELSPALDAVRCAITNLLGGSYQNPHFSRDHRFVVEKGKDGLILQVAQLSQGYKSMLALGMDFARRLALANPHLNYSNPAEGVWGVLDDAPQSSDLDPLPQVATMLAPAVMLVDEIDVHLHPSWQQKILSDLLRTFPNTQFIVTTHSPQVLTSVDRSSIRILQDETDPETGKTRTVVRGVDWQTRGVASSDLLAQIMNVDPIPSVPEAEWVTRYHALIQQNLHETDSGKDLRHQLEQHFGTGHPILLECDRMIRLQQFKQRLPINSAKQER
jgi:predicted ATP-binding protein involved in virulence